MLSRASEDLISHVRGMWGYLRFGVAVCAAFFAVSGLVALAQNGSWAIIATIAAGVVLLLVFVVAVAAVVPETSSSSPPALAETILMYSLPLERSAECRGVLAEMFANILARDGPTAARVWYWTQLVRIIRHAGKFRHAGNATAIKVVVEAMAGVTTLLHFFMK